LIRVLYDHQMFSLQQYGGVSRYFANLYTSFKDGGEVQPSISVLYSFNEYIKDSSFASPAWLWQFLLKKKKRRYRWNQKYSLAQIKKQQYDLFHPTYYDPYFINSIQKPYVITVYDMIYELFPGYFEATDKFVLNKRKVIEKAQHIIAISHATKNDLQRLYGIPESKITVVHLGFLNKADGAKPELPFKEDYILFVGERANYKNFTVFVKAMLPLLKEKHKLRIVCTGGNSFSKEEHEFFQFMRIDQQMIQVSASGSLLNALYRNAKVFVFPSLYEGFGFPLLEAFANNCPVAASNTSSFTEVGGNAVCYFNPENETEMLTSVQKILNEPAYAEGLRREGMLQLEKFKNETCAEQTLQVYKKVLGI
jgi:glycosyltransferase involved in cell wall biosynthesis